MSRMNRTCKFCTLPDCSWKWESIAGSSRRNWYLVDSNGNRHSCQGGKQTPQDTPEATPAKAATPKLDKPKVLTTPTGDGTLEGSILSFFDEQTKAAVSRIGDVTEIIGGTLDRIPGAVEDAIREALPVEHKIVVKTDDIVREMSGRPHEKLQELIAVIAARLNVFMVGPAGSGKTTAARQAAEGLGLKCYVHSMGPATSEWDLIGYKSPNGDYIPGIMREPFEFGGVLSLDELDNSNPSVLTALNAAMANGHCTFPDGEIVKHKDFILVAAGNTYGRGADRMYVGRNQLDAATLDRFVVIDWGYDNTAELEWAGPDAGDWVSYVQRVRQEIETHNMRVIVSPRASIFGAILARNGMDYNRIQEMVLWKGISSDDKNRIIGNVGKFTPKAKADTRF